MIDATIFASQPSWVYFLLGLCFVCIVYMASHRRLGRGITHPPGPPPRWITGNLHQLSEARSEPWLTFASWSKIYGPVVYYRVMGKETVVLNSAKAVLDLFESRSAIYSDRPIFWMGGELVGRKHSIFMTSSASNRLKALRRLLTSGLNPRATKDYRPIHNREAQALLKSLADSPDDFAAHVRKNSVAVILQVAYGYSVKSNDDPFVEIIEEGFKAADRVAIPGKFWVEFLPFLRFIPEWVPGAGFKRIAREARTTMARLEQVPYAWAKSDISSGSHIESFLSKHLTKEGQTLDDETEDLLKWSSAGLYAGAGDTTVSALTTFFLVMSLYPDVQRQAQAEVDHIAPNRLPTMEDYDSMPYIRAIIKEVLRWGPVAPLGVLHRVTQDDIYGTYLIPKGATVISNIWAIAHDDEMYPNPSVFDPSRHIGEKAQPDPFKFVFGYGRRVCPGAHFAEVSLFLTMSCVLSVFNISKKVGKDGRVIEPEISWTTGVTSHLRPFTCDVKPRSAEHLLLLERQD